MPSTSLPVPVTLPPYHPKTDMLLAVIETVRGSRTKVKFDEMLGAYIVHKVLPAGTSFPFDFGFIPKTEAEDGDPLDVLVLMEEPVFTGCVVEIRLLGVLEGEQTEKGKTFRNDRLLAVATASCDFADIKEAQDIPRAVREQIEQFFVTYNDLQGKKFKILAIRGPDEARKLIKKARRAAKNS